ncbi:hypothetical protein LY76DRAFT_675243 [Colletotrichum caudatum]|nr:hypothetical protein LY76DRAFT_675243 [Colletotrichum caudatum]
MGPLLVAEAEKCGKADLDVFFGGQKDVPEVGKGGLMVKLATDDRNAWFVPLHDEKPVVPITVKKPGTNKNAAVERDSDGRYKITFCAAGLGNVATLAVCEIRMASKPGRASEPSFSLVACLSGEAYGVAAIDTLRIGAADTCYKGPFDPLGGDPALVVEVRVLLNLGKPGEPEWHKVKKAM